MGNKEENNIIKVVELFAGVGGFRAGLEQASTRFKTIYANQWEPNKKSENQYAYKCYISHYGNNPSYTNQDISLIKREIPSHDLLVGGFPCQDYSVAHGNSAKGIEGKKGVLWWEIRDVIAMHQPKMILLENVDRLIKSPVKQKGRDFAIMLRSLYDEGYNAEWRVINAADYGFVQRRRRVFIFAYKRALLKELFTYTSSNCLIESSGFFADIFPYRERILKKTLDVVISEKKYKDLVDISDNFSGIFYNSGVLVDGQVLSYEIKPQIKVGQTLGDILEKQGVDDKYFIDEKDLDKFQFFKNHKRIPRFTPDLEIYFYSEGKMSLHDPMDRPSRTILTSESKLSRTTHVVLDPQTNLSRLLTPIECERLNGFSDNWTNTNMPESYRYFCMGNALVVPLIKVMGEKINIIWKGRNIYE